MQTHTAPTRRHACALTRCATRRLRSRASSRARSTGRSMPPRTSWPTRCARAIPGMQRPALDWDATLAFREHLWRLGFKVAEAMDTAQRGMGLDWPTARELIRRSVAHAKTMPGADLVVRRRHRSTDSRRRRQRSPT